MTHIDVNTEAFDRLVTVLKQRMGLGQTREEIFEDLTPEYGVEVLFLAYHSAKILFKYDRGFYD